MGQDLVIHKKERVNPYWITYILNRIKKQSNMLIATVGRVGAGKTSSSLAIAEMLDPDFTADNIVFSIEELVELVHNGKIDRSKDQDKQIKEETNE